MEYSNENQQLIATNYEMQSGENVWCGGGGGGEFKKAEWGWSCCLVIKYLPRMCEVPGPSSAPPALGNEKREYRAGLLNKMSSFTVCFVRWDVSF